MPLVHYTISTYLKRRCSGIDKHSDENMQDLRLAETTFDGEYLEASPHIFRAILPLEITPLKGEGIRYGPIR